MEGKKETRKRKDGLFCPGSYFRICSREAERGEPFEQRENARSLPINTQRNRGGVISRVKCPGFLYESFRRNRA